MRNFIIHYLRGLCIFSLVLVGHAQAAEDELRVGVGVMDNIWYYQKDDGSVAGVWPEFYETLSRETGIPIKIVVMPSARIAREISLGSIDFSQIPVPSKNGAIPLNNAPLVSIIVGSQAVPDIQSLDQLKGKTVAMLKERGAIIGLENSKEIKMITYQNMANACHLLARERADYVVALQGSIETACEKEGVVLGNPYVLMELTFYVWSSDAFRNSPHYDAVLEGLATLRQNKQFELSYRNNTGMQ